MEWQTLTVAFSFVQHRGDGFADDQTAADDDGVFSFDRDAVEAQQLDDARRRAGARPVLVGQQVAEVEGVDAVDVLGGRHGADDLVRVESGGQRQLHQDAVDILALVQLFDLRLERFGLYSGGVGKHLGRRCPVPGRPSPCS